MNYKLGKFIENSIGAVATSLDIAQIPLAIVGVPVYGLYALQNFYDSDENKHQTSTVQFEARDKDSSKGLDILVIEGKEFEIERANSGYRLKEKIPAEKK